MNELAEVIGGVPPRSVVVLTGAGVSAEGPASLPTGWEMTRRVFGAFFDEGALATVLRHHAWVGWWLAGPCPHDRLPRPEPRPPRLETVLGVAADVYGYQAVAEVLADVRDAQPNRLHRFFAAHLNRGGRHLTANFDGCIERAADECYPRWPDDGRIFHFHGSIAGDPSGRSLGATLQRIQGGFDDQQTSVFRRLLPADGILAVFGYSGSDFFDVDTAVAALPAGALDLVHVVWVAHSIHAWHGIDPSGPAAPPLAAHLRRAGARVDLVCGPTGELISEIARRWGLPTVGEPVARTLRIPLVTADEEHRRAATFRLYRELGLLDELAALLRPGAPRGADPAQIWKARSELLWEQGRWNTLRRMWLRATIPEAIPATVRIERIGACLWVQGRLLPAYLWLTGHRRRCRDPKDMLMLAETEGRVIEHMARIPELRLLARRLAPGLISLLGDTGQTAGIDLYRRRNDLASSLRSITGKPRAQTEAATSSQWFTEAGSLLAALNYRHRQYRDTYSATHLSDVELARRYRQLQQHFDSIGSPSGRCRTHLLPGAERVFTTTEVLHGLHVLQYGWWHRTRLITRYLPLRIRHWLRRPAEIANHWP
jgi:hypothetical protein